MTISGWLRLYRLIARAARFDAADLRTAHAEATFVNVCAAAARRGWFALTTTAVRELGVVAAVIALAYLRSVPRPRVPRAGDSLRDLRIGVRSLLTTHRGYLAMSTFVLATAVGVNLVVFTVVNALWIRPLPFAHADRVVTIPRMSWTQAQLDLFEGGVAHQVDTAGRNAHLRPLIEIPEAGRPLETLGVTPGYFGVFRLRVRGRDFTPDDDRAGADPVAIISDRLWSRGFGRRAEAIGAIVSARPFPIRVIGVAPPDFEGARRGERADMWIPAALVRRLASAEPGRILPTIVFARLGSGQTPAAVEQGFRELMNPVVRDWFARNQPDIAAEPTIVPVTRVFGTPDTRTFIVTERDAMLVVSGLALLVLLGGCATIAALVLVHYEKRRSELALKMSLGAPRFRLVIELLRDLSIVAGAGSGGGLLIAALGVRLLPALRLPGGVDIGRLDLSIDWRVSVAAIAATAATLVLAAAVPIVRSTRPRLSSELFGGTSSATPASQRIRQALLALQVCASIVVLVAAGLFVRAVLHGFGSAPGFDVDRTVFVSVQEAPPPSNPADERDPQRLVGFYQALMAERADRLSRALRELPGVDDVAAGMSPIGSDASILAPLTIKTDDGEHQLSFGRLSGGPGLISALGVPILAGRHLTTADLTSNPVATVITRPLAERIWPGGLALGRTFSIRQLGRRSGGYLVVGIAGDLAFGSLADRNSGVLVTAQADGGHTSTVSHFVIGTDRPETVAGEIRRTIKGQVVQVATGREIVARDLGRQRLGAWFFSGFGLAALLLGVGGAFGLVAYLAESQRREFGVRVALGADTRHLLRQGLVAALQPVAVGVVSGLLAAAVVSQVFTALLAGISAVDTLTYFLVAITMLGCATIAALAAAWRLRRTTPSDALRAT
jgi:predicted permease